MKLYGYIYKYTYPNGKVYIGQTRVSVKERHYQHMSASKDPSRRTICEVAIAKYGEPLLETIETISVSEDQKTKLVDLLNEAEKKWIKHYDSTNRHKGYNIQNGGERVTPEDFILQEKWYEIFDRDGWGAFVMTTKDILNAIKGKMFDTHEKLNKEEKYIWFGYKFMDYLEGKETTFKEFYERYKGTFLCDIGDVPVELLEIIDDKNTTVEKRRWAENEIDKVYFDDIIGYAIEENWIEDIRQTIWRQINKKKDRIVKEWYSSK